MGRKEGLLTLKSDHSLIMNVEEVTLLTMAAGDTSFNIKGLLINNITLILVIAGPPVNKHYNFGYPPFKLMF